MCLAWCLAASRFRANRQAQNPDPSKKVKPVASGYRTHHYKDELSKINLDGIQFPASERDVSF